MVSLKALDIYGWNAGAEIYETLKALDIAEA
jgi:hypothetical protein